MFDAGSAVVTLTGRVVREPFENYGRLIDVVRAQKEHYIELGARTVTTGFDTFMKGITGIKSATREASVSIRDSMANISASTNRTAVSTDRDMGAITGATNRAAKSFLLIGDSAKEMSKVVAGEDNQAVRSVSKMADVHKASADSIIRDNERIAASGRGAAGALGGGRGGHGGGGTAMASSGGPFGAASEHQAKKTTAAWKEGANTLANLGKWTTIASAGIGFLTVKWAADFDRQMELVRTQVGYSQKDVDRLRKSVLNLAPAVGVGPAELAKGLYHVTSVLQGQGGTNQAMNILRIAAEGAKVGMANMEDVSSALMAIYKSAPRDIHNVNEAMGVMNDIVGQGNLRMEDLSKALTTGVLAAAINAHLGLRDLGAALDTMTSRGVPAEQAATRLRTTLTLMSAPTGKAQKALAELGMSSTQLATDMQKHGLVYALQDLQNHLNKTFPPGGHLSVAQERQALMQYGQQLQATGVSGKALEKDLAAFKKRLENTGSSAVQQSQLITQAFGGSRMGTTMALLLQNADDVRTRFDNLNKANAAGRFQKDWQETQKEFSVQAGKMWAGIQKLGIQLGEWLIPKLRAVVTWLIHAAHWLGKHKALAEALAITFGTVLTAAVVAFFGRFLLRTAEGLKAMGQFGKYIAVDLPQQAGRGFKWLLSQLGLVKTSAEEATTAVDGLGAGPAGGPGGGGVGGVVGEAGGGMMLGMIEGIMGAAAPGSRANPLAVVVLASGTFGMGASGAAAEAETAATAESRAAQVAGAEGQMALPGMGRFGRMGGAGEQMMLPGMAPAAERAAAAETAMMGETAVAPSLMSRMGGAIMPGLMGLGMGAMAQSAVGLRGGTVGTLAGGGVGAAIGTLIAPGIGTAIGAGIGSALGPTVGHLLNSIFGSGPSQGQRAAQAVTRGVTGTITGPVAMQDRSVSDVRSAIQRNIDDAQKALHPIALRYGIQPPTAAELAHAKNSLEQAGRLSGQAFVAGYQEHIKDVSGASLVANFEDKMRHLPKSMGGIAKNAAASQMLEYAAGLEANKQLPAGETKKIIRELESYYPGLRKYLRDQAESTDAELATAFKLKTSRSILQGSIKYLEDQFMYIPKSSHVTMGNMTQEFQGGMKYLEKVIHSSTGKQRDDAIAAYKELARQFDQYLGLMETRTQQHMKNIQKELQQGSQTAVNKVVPYWDQYISIIGAAEAAGVITVQQGNKLIARELENALKALGFTGKQAQNLAKAGYTVQDVSNLQHGAHGSSLVHLAQTAAGGHAGGGFLPGREYGTQDVMTLIDPQGKPRARMAGDEAIFSRHQMPFVEAGLQMLGFRGAEDLWHKVNTPHSVGYEKGGKLRRFAVGGAMGGNSPYSQYSLPLPISMMRLPWSPDQGIDIPAPAHTPEFAIGPGVIVQEGIQGFGPWAPILRVTSGPLAGTQFYYGHAGPNFAHRGQHVQAGQAITQVGAGIVGISTGPHIEFGFWPPRGGSATAAFLRALMGGAGVAQFAGPGGGLGALGAGWTDLRPPRVRATGAVAAEAQGVLNQVTKAANQFGSTQAWGMYGMTGAGWSGGGDSVQNEQLGRKMMRAAGWGLNQWPYLQRLWSKESNWQTRALNASSGAYGIPQSLPADKMASAGQDWKTNPATQIAWGLNYIRGTYGSPQNAWAHEVGHNWYNRGGWLRSFARGGANPWAPLPSGTLHLPGYRPFRVRRGTGGLHTVGGGRHGGHGGAGGSGGRGAHPRQHRTTRIGMTQAVANTLADLGFGDIGTLDQEIGNLDTQYQNQESLFTTFAGTGGLSPDELDTLMGIREKQWDIAYRAWKWLPYVTKALGHDVTALQGRQHKGHWKYTGTGRHRTRKWVPVSYTGGIVPDLTAAVTHTEDEIARLQHELQVDSRAIASIHHNITGASMTLADHLANQVAAAVNQVDVLNNRKYQNSQKRINLQSQLRSLPSASSSGGGLGLSQIVSGVMLGTLPASGSAAANPTKTALKNRIADLHADDVRISHVEQGARSALSALRVQKADAVRRLREQGFNEAWAITTDKYKIQDKIFRLRQTLKKLKASLKAEQQAAKADAAALQTLENAQTGGLQGGQSAGDALESVGMNILNLYQQGADLPTHNRSGPTLKDVTDFLSAPPPHGMGLSLPPGLASGASRAATIAAQAYEQFLSFQASRASLFSQFGSNFVGAGVNPAGSTPGMGAGVQFYGAAAPPTAGAGSPGGGLERGGWLAGTGPKAGDTTITIHQNFAAGPPDPHTYAAGVTHELRAQM